MYCIHCGKKLKEGEVCSCRKKKKKRILHTILGWLCWLLGAGVFAYLFLINKEFLQELEIPFLKGFAGYLAFGLPAILFLVGMILSIRGILSKKTRAFAGSLFLLSFVGILGMGALLGLRVRKLNEAVETIAVGLDDSSAERVKEIYEDAWNGEKTVLKEKLLEQAEQIRADFQAETLTYEEALEKITAIEEAELIEFDGEELRTELTGLQTSRDAFAKASKLEEEKNYPEAIAEYQQVIESDSNYQTAQEKIDTCREACYQEKKAAAEAYAEAEDYENAILMLEEAKAYTENTEEAETLMAGYEEQKETMLSNTKGTLASVESAFAGEELTYEEALTKVEEVRSQGILSEEEISAAKTNLETMKKSHDAYHAAAEAEESGDYQTALEEYAKVISSDNFYSDAQVRIPQCRDLLVANVIAQAKTKYEAYDIQGARTEISKGLQSVPDNEELQNLLETYQAAEPVKLGEMEIFANVDAYGENLDTYLTDNYGNIYDHSFSYVDGEIVYLTNYQYSYLSGTVACPKGMDTNATGLLTVYGDGEKLKSFQMDILSAPVEFDLPIGEYERISLVWYSEGDLWDDWGELATIFDGEWIPAGSILEEKAEADRAARREARLAAKETEETEETEDGDASFYKDGTVVAQNTFILPESEYQYLSESDLSNLTLKGLCYAKNEIYARHGRKFKSKELQEYFSKQS